MRFRGLGVMLVSLGVSCGQVVTERFSTRREGGTDANSVISDGASSTRDVDSSHEIPVNHGATDMACPKERALGMLPACTWDCYDAGFMCLVDSDCTMGTNGRCLPPDSSPGVNFTITPDYEAKCSYDECFTDSDCPPSEPCICRASTTDSTPNVCVSGSNCRVDADCGPGGYCSPSAYASGSLVSCSNLSVAYFCHTAADTCANDTDCTGAGTCGYDTAAGHWSCCSIPP
jgi:hypothetical protein